MKQKKNNTIIPNIPLCKEATINLNGSPTFQCNDEPKTLEETMRPNSNQTDKFIEFIPPSSKN